MKIVLTCLSILLASVADAGGFDVTGQVLGVNRADFGWILLAGDARPNNFNVDGHVLPDCRSGDIVRARGCTRTDANGRSYEIATNVVVVGSAPLPETREIASFQINAPALYHRCVRIRGVVSSVQHDDTNKAWNQIALRTPAGRICAVVQDDRQPLAELRRLVDAEVSLAGYVTRFGTFLSFLGNELLLFEKDGITVLTPPPSDPFSSPARADCPLRGHRRQLGRQHPAVRLPPPRLRQPHRRHRRLAARRPARGRTSRRLPHRSLRSLPAEL